MAEIIKIDEETAEAIAFEDHPDYVLVEERSIDSGRWHEFMVSIVQRESDKKLFKMSWSKALTEMQEHEFYGAKLVEVEKKTRTIVQTYYEEVE